jgi:hypothetical protein
MWSRGKGGVKVEAHAHLSRCALIRLHPQSLRSRRVQVESAG